MKTQKLIRMAAIVCLLLGASGVAEAATVERDGENVSAIRNLELGSFIYDVEFFNYTAAAIYPGDPPRFDFDTREEAEDAVEAVIAVLNAEGGVSEVGRTADTGLPFFRVGYELWSTFIDINFWFLDINQEIRLVKVWEGTTDNPDLGSTNWIKPSNPDVFPYLDDGSFAQFTVVGTGGTGNLPPKADADGPYAGAVDEVVTFDGTGSSDPDGDIVSYEWSFGDDSTGTGETTSHSYTAAGTYNISLTVTDESDVSASDSSTAKIGTDNQPPTVDAGGPYVGTVGVAINFDGSSGSSDPEGNIDTYLWFFGDGGATTGPTPSHTYTASGSYSVILMATDNDGETASDTTTAEVAMGNQPPMAEAGPPATGVVGVPVSFDGTGSSDLDGDIASYDWFFGDGATGTGQTPSYTYSVIDNYIVILTVTDNNGASDSSFTAAAIDDEVCRFELAGDIDRNCKVDLVDFALMADSWLINCNNTPDDPLCIPLD
jgi:PKD repeat protein